MTTQFDNLRTTPWSPAFEWCGDILAVALQINLWHEDFPQRVPATVRALKRLRSEMVSVDFGAHALRNQRLLGIHKTIFGDTSFGGQWRRVNVYIGDHTPPPWREVSHYMATLERAYYFNSWHRPALQHFLDWYRDFETIHPFQDGNGRVGGVVIAAYSHLLHPTSGWLGPNQ